jgi:hypothetical protein
MLESVCIRKQAHTQHAHAPATVVVLPTSDVAPVDSDVVLSTTTTTTDTVVSIVVGQNSDTCGAATTAW